MARCTSECGVRTPPAAAAMSGCRRAALSGVNYYFVCAVTYTDYNRMSNRKIYRGYCLLYAALRHTAHLLSGKATHETAKPAPSASRSTSIT